MRNGITVTVLVVWFAVLGACQLFGCILDALAHACCHKHTVSQPPCPHDLLEKAKAGPPVLAHALTAAPAVCIPFPEISHFLSTSPVPAESYHGSDLYLRNRVLLI